MPRDLYKPYSIAGQTVLITGKLISSFPDHPPYLTKLIFSSNSTYHFIPIQEQALASAKAAHGVLQKRAANSSSLPVERTAWPL